jgi:hypothetical protein
MPVKHGTLHHMDSHPWAALAGVVIGAVLTFLGQSSSRKQRYELSVVERKMSVRADLMKAIYGFLDSVQHIEELLDAQYLDLQAGQPWSPPDHTKITKVHRMWFQQKCLQVVGSEGLREASRALTLTMEGLVLYEPPPKVREPNYRIWMNEDRRRDSADFQAEARIQLFPPEIDVMSRFGRLTGVFKGWPKGQPKRRVGSEPPNTASLST